MLLLYRNHAIKEKPNPIKASLADNASLLGGKAEGDLSVAFADVARGLDETTMGAIRSMIPDNNSKATDLSDELWKKVATTTRVFSYFINEVTSNNPHLVSYDSDSFREGLHSFWDIPSHTTFIEGMVEIYKIKSPPAPYDGYHPWEFAENYIEPTPIQSGYYISSGPENGILIECSVPVCVKVIATGY